MSASLPVELQRLLAEAAVLAGGQHQCAVLGHKWESQGGRICPRGDEMGGGPCSQTVYVCGSCGLEDYGNPGGPAHDECFKFGPCDPGCIDAELSPDDLALYGKGEPRTLDECRESFERLFSSDSGAKP